jgi:hypothetical protein
MEIEICGGQQTRSQYFLYVEPSFAVRLTGLVLFFEKYNVRIIVHTIPMVCAKLSTSENPNSTVFPVMTCNLL